MILARLKRYVRTAITLAYHARYRLLGIPVPRTRDTRGLWEQRGTFWMDEMANTDPRVTADHQRMSALFVELLGATGFTRLLDVGCGYGMRLKPLREAFPDKTIAGLDFSWNMLRNGQRYLAGLDRLPTIHADATRSPFRANCFDAAITWSVLNVMPPEIMRATLREIRRVMRGTLIVMEEDARHDTEVSAEEHALAEWYFAHDYEAEFAAAGFQVRQVVTLDDLQVMRYTVYVLTSP